MRYQRRLDLREEVKRKSVFLFGPRQTGKTTLLQELFPKSPFFNLLRGEVFLRLSQRPSALREEILAASETPGPIIIDEVQKLPRLLDEVHDLIESTGRTFVLSASSPVKLRGGGHNSLGGRARIRHLHPFVSAEVPNWSLRRAIRYGGIPSVYLSSEPEDELRDYCGAYLQMEVQAEGLVRGIEPFSRFLRVAALSAGEQVNFERAASDAAVPARTVREFYQVLQDTLVGELLPVFVPKIPKRKPAAHAKFYFFDVGVANSLVGSNDPVEGTEPYGRVFEHLVYGELRAFLDYGGDRRPMTYWRTSDGSEVDFVVGDEIAIEVKSSRRVSDGDFRGLARLGEEVPLRRQILVCGEEAPRRVGTIDILPIERFFSMLWEGEIL
jgi:predicted AAA+ superfamily ATPase